jgi:hypothetical protein
MIRLLAERWKVKNHFVGVDFHLPSLTIVPPRSALAPAYVECGF